MSASHLSLLSLSLAVLLGACDARPFVVDEPTEAWERVSAERPTAPVRDVFEYNPDPRPISLCYSAQLNNQTEVMNRARSLCPYQGRLEFHSEDAFVNGCSLLQPNRVRPRMNRLSSLEEDGAPGEVRHPAQSVK